MNITFINNSDYEHRVSQSDKRMFKTSNGQICLNVVLLFLQKYAEKNTVSAHNSKTRN